MVASVPLSTGGYPANRNAINATAAAAATIQSILLAMVLPLIVKIDGGVCVFVRVRFAMADMTSAVNVAGGSTSCSSFTIGIRSSPSRQGWLVLVIVLLASRPANRRVVVAPYTAAISPSRPEYRGSRRSRHTTGP